MENAIIFSRPEFRLGNHYILEYCDKEYPKLSARVVGITDDDHRRPWRDMLITHKVTPADIDGMHLIEME